MPDVYSSATASHFFGAFPDRPGSDVSTPARPSESPKQRPANPLPEARRATADAARPISIRELIDLSRRNSLLYYRPLKSGTLEFSSAPAENVRELLAGESVPARKLQPDLEDEALPSFCEIFPVVGWRIWKKGAFLQLRVWVFRVW